MKIKIIKNILIFTFIFLMVSKATSQFEISLKKSFLDSIKDKITLKLDYNLDYANDKDIDIYSSYYTKRGHPERNFNKSSDLIMYGSNLFIGLPIVAKILNAKADSKAVNFISQNKGKKINLIAVWRLWCNYFGNDIFTQGKTNDVCVKYNSEHIFELEPVLRINENKLTGYNEEIISHRIYNAKTAFEKYTSTRCRIVIEDSIITLITQGVGCDFVDFVLQINELADIKNDGRIILGNAYSNDGNLLFKNLKLVFIKDSEPEKTVRKLTKGDKLRVLGMPRIDLKEISSRIEISETNKDVLNNNLPFEIVILSVLNN